MKTALAIGVLILAFVLYRPIAKWAVMPSDTHASWVEPLATEGTGLCRVSELWPASFQLPEMQERYSPLIKANEQKRHLLATYFAGKGRYGLFRRYSTVEGAWIYTWLLVKDGHLRYVHDHTRDGGAPATAVDTSIPKSVRVGFLRDGEFVEGAPGPKDSPIVVIELDIGRYDPARFY